MRVSASEDSSADQDACNLNMTIGQWLRAIDMVLDEYTPGDGTADEEADYVTKLALLLMMTRCYDESDICLLLDSTALRIPRRLSQTSKFDLTKILDKILDKTATKGEIEDFRAPDPHASPNHSMEETETRLDLKQMRPGGSRSPGSDSEGS